MARGRDCGSDGGPKQAGPGKEFGFDKSEGLPGGFVAGQCHDDLMHVRKITQASGGEWILQGQEGKQGFW